ncbi:hypothetical protein ACI78Q_00280 [Geodermatophilus sp. SYSU D00705]
MQDMAGHLAALQAFIDEQGRAAATRLNDDIFWRRWTEHCQEVAEKYGLIIDPEDAPFLAFEELVLQRRADGKPIAASTTDRYLAAIRWRYAELGRVPAHQRPENANAWRELRRGQRKQEGERRAAGDPPREQAVPLFREDLVRMLRAEPPRTPWLDERRALVLLALDTDLSTPQLQELDTADVELIDTTDPTEPGGIRVAGYELPCDHAERFPGVPWDCTACAVRAALAARTGGGPLLTSGAEALPTYLGVRRRRWAGLQMARRYGPALDVDPTLSPRALAGLRRGLVLTVDPKGAGFRWARARAWTALSWVCGFRMGSDVAGLDRCAVAVDAAGRGYRIDLAATKDDPEAVKDVARPLAWSATGGPSAAQAVAEYLCVRDASAGRAGTLLVEAVPPHGPVARLRACTLAGKDLDLLCEYAGLPKVYSSYSTRVGYTQQAERDGWLVEEISAGLRHQSLETTVQHYTGASNARGAVTKLINSKPGSEERVA